MNVEMTKETPYIMGKKIVLRGIEKEDLPFFVRWINDSEVTHFMFMGDRPALLSRLAQQWEKESASPVDIPFLIVARDSERPIGSAGLYGINWISRAAEFRIIIGEKDYWNRGIGSEGARLLLRFAFEKLNLNKVWLGVNAENLGGVRAYEKAGFVREGILRKEIYRNGRYYDAIRMSILRDEWREFQDA